MLDLLSLVFSDAELSTLVGLVVIAVLLVLCWWEFYAKPCRDSLRNIEAALLAAPWMRPETQSRLRKSA